MLRSQSITLTLFALNNQNREKRSDVQENSFKKVFNEVKNNVNMNKDIKTNNSNQKTEQNGKTSYYEQKNNTDKKANTLESNKIDKDKQTEIQKDINDDNRYKNHTQNLDDLIELLNLLNAINLKPIKDMSLNNIDLNWLNQFENSLKDLANNLDNLKLKMAYGQIDIADFKVQDDLNIGLNIGNEIIDIKNIKGMLNDFLKALDLKDILQEKVGAENIIDTLPKSIKDITQNLNDSLVSKFNVDTKNNNIDNQVTLSQLTDEIKKFAGKVQDILKDTNEVINITQDDQNLDTSIKPNIINNVKIIANIENANDLQISSKDNNISDESQSKDGNKDINNQSNFSNIIHIGNKVNFQTFKELQINQVQKTEIIQKVADSIKIAIEKDMANVNISLKPESLGKIVIELTKDANGFIKGNIIVQTNEVKEAVSSSLNNLVSMLKDQGINISGLNVGLNQQSQNQNNFMQRRYKPTKQIDTSQVNIDSIFYGIEEGYFSMKA